MNNNSYCHGHSHGQNNYIRFLMSTVPLNTVSAWIPFIHTVHWRENPGSCPGPRRGGAVAGGRVAGTCGDGRRAGSCLVLPLAVAQQFAPPCCGHSALPFCPALPFSTPPAPLAAPPCPCSPAPRSPRPLRSPPPQLRRRTAANRPRSVHSPAPAACRPPRRALAPAPRLFAAPRTAALARSGIPATRPGIPVTPRFLRR